MAEKKIKPKIFKDIKQGKGITLIALVITIIVLLILAGVALATLTGNNNIIENANEAVGTYNNSVNDEKATMGDIENLFEKYVTGEDNPPAPTGPVDEDGLATGNVTIKPDPDSNVQITIPTGFAPAILATGTTQSGPGEDGSVASIMPYEQWNNITVEDINKGIVIVDNAITYDNGQTSGTVPDFNEYVWIPIPESTNFKRTEWTVRGETPGLAENPSTDEEKQNKYWDYSSTIEDSIYTNMVASVGYYKGFYIGRYEASQGSGDIAQSKRKQTTWTSVAQTTAKTACTNNTIGGIQKHLIYGIEWDSALNWLIGKAQISSSTSGVTKTMEIGDVQTNSSSWGNYSNSTGDAATNSGTKQTTGYSEYWKANNIYDLAGNVYEWTQENYSTGTDRALRGRVYTYDGDGYPVASRDSFDESFTFSYLRIPCQLFCSTGHLNIGDVLFCGVLPHHIFETV